MRFKFAVFIIAVSLMGCAKKPIVQKPYEPNRAFCSQVETIISNGVNRFEKYRCRKSYTGGAGRVYEIDLNTGELLSVRYVQ